MSQCPVLVKERRGQVFQIVDEIFAPVADLFDQLHPFVLTLECLLDVRVLPVIAHALKELVVLVVHLRQRCVGVCKDVFDIGCHDLADASQRFGVLQQRSSSHASLVDDLAVRVGTA